MSTLVHLKREQLEAGLDTIRRSPRDCGVLEMIVRRPRVGAREILREGQLDLVEGLLGTAGSDAAAPGRRTAAHTRTCS